MIRTLTTFDFDALLGEASGSPRRRAISPARARFK